MAMALRPQLRTGAWYGDRPLALDFPRNWDVRILWPQTPPPLTDEQVLGALERPIGQDTIRQSCRGKTRPLVIVDDLNRPTPAVRVMPSLLRQFEDSGIPAGEIRVLMARGTHGAPGKDGMLKKIGAAAASSCRLLIHEPTRDTVKIGRTSYGTPIWVNREVVSSDFVVGIGGVYPNHTAGFGGGSKLAMGVLDLRTISYLHHHHRSMGWGCACTDGDLRKDLDEIARAIHLNTMITTHVNVDRELVRLTCGDHFLLYQEEVTFARQAFRAPIPEGADVVISNAHPNDLSFTFVWMKGLVPLQNCASGASRIAIASCSEGLGSHGVFPVVNIPKLHAQRDLLRRLSVMSAGQIAGKIVRQIRRTTGLGSDLETSPPKDGGSPDPKNPIWLYRPGTHAQSLPSLIRGIRVSPSWPEILQAVQREQAHQRRLKVLLYPCAPLQFLERFGTDHREPPVELCASGNVEAD
jgi:nickel-dependent lactate racemase